MECLLAIGTSVLEKVANYTVVAIGRQLGYIFYYKSNVDNLNNQTQELGVRKNRLGNRVEEARRNGEEIEGDVQDWLKEVEQIAEKTNSFLEDERHTKTRCSGCSFPNIVLRHKLSRKAKKMIQTVESEIQKTEKFESISSHPILQWSIENKGYETFESRKEIFKEIFEALKDPNVNMIGVYGMGGIGKTMLAKEVARQTMEEKIFNETIFASVSQTPNIEKIQQEVAEKLGLQKFDEIKSISVRAVRLRLRLRQEKRILIILDDVWEELKLFDVGIYFEDDQKGCKIMLTSRSVDVLQNFTNVIAKNFPIEVVSFDEARSLFKRTVGDKVGNPSFHSLIDEMVTECAGLPLAIRTVAYALKDKGLSTWKDALLQLKRSTSTNIEGMSEKVYSSIKLSFDLLGSEEAKTLLLLCCLHEEDANIYIENLMGYSVGWGLFPDVDTLEETRDRVHSLVDKLKGKCLLLEGEYHGTIKVHDVIRDVSISIASKDRRMNIVTNVTKLEEHMNKRVLKDSIAISLIDHHLDRLPSRLEFPQLELFFMFNVSRSLLIPDHFFEETKELRALYLSYVYQGSLPSSFYFLQSLQTLSLRNCKLRDIAIIGELKNLKILDLSDSDIEQLPKQIGQLRGLRVLNLSWCYGLKVIQPHVISSLVNLEELSLETFTEWEVERSDTERSNASLTELKNLSQLTTLQLCVLDANILPRDLFTENIKRYQVFIGGRSYRYGYERYGSRFLHLDLPKSILSYDHAGLDILIKRSEVVHLAGFEGLHNIVYELQNEGFSQVKNFLLKNNAQIRYIVDTTDKIQPCSAFENLDTLILGTLVNLEEICYGELSADSFGKLRQTFVRNCDSLKSLFPLSTTRQLEVITVTDCKMMEVVVPQERQDDAHKVSNETVNKLIEFHQLRSLTLNSLPKLVAFLQFESDASGSSSSLDSPVPPLFSEKIAFPRLEQLNLSGMNIRKLLPEQPPTTSYVQNLTSLTIQGCNNLRYLSSFVVARCLVQLQYLKIMECKVMEEVLVTWKEVPEEGRLRKIFFPKLEYLTLLDIPNLVRFSAGESIECPSLRTLTIKHCAKLRTFISNASMTDDILEEMEHVANKQPLFNEKVLFPNLESLTTDWSEVVEEICQSQSSTIPYSDLRHLHLTCSRYKPVVSSFKFIHRYQNLESFTLSGFFSVRHEIDDDRKLVLSLPSLTRLRNMNLYDLPMLTSDLFEEPKNLHQPHKAFQALENLDIQRCGRLPSLVSFKHLNDLRVSECHGMINLFDLSTAKSLVQLTRMSITRCKRMTEIIGQESETNYDSQTESEIVFGQLKILVIHCLPSLRSFYSGHNIMRLPKLERLIVSHCPEMRCFSDGIVTNNPGMDGNIGEYDEEWVAERFANMSHYFFHLSENAKFDRQLWEGEVNMIVRKVWEEDTCSTLQQLYMDDQNSSDDDAHKFEDKASSS